MSTTVDNKEELARVTRALGIELHALLTSIPDQILVLDRKQRVMAVWGGWPYESPARPDDLIGKRISHVFGAHPAAHENANLHALQGEGVTYEWAIPNGQREVRLSTAVSPLRNSSSKIVGLVAVTRNTTSLTAEEKRLADSIAQKTQQLLELERGVRQLTEVIESYRQRDVRVQGRVENKLDTPLRQLSSREHDVLHLLRQGYRPRSIADILHVSPQTVRNHLKAIFKKTDTHSQEELITMSRRSADSL